MSEAPSSYRLWSLREDVHVETDPDSGAVTLHSRWEDTSLLPVPGPAVREALRRMSLGPILLENVTRDPVESADIQDVLERLQHLVVRSVAVDADRPLMSVVPLTPQARFAGVELGDDRLIRLSRFALLQTDGGEHHLESPLSLHRVIFHVPHAARIVAALGRPMAAGAIVAAAGPVPRLPTAELLAHLVATGMVVVAEPGAAGRQAVFAEDVDPALTSWRPLELMFHVQTSLGYHDQDYGMTYRVERGVFPLEPVVLPPHEGTAIDLYRPRWSELLATDPPFTAVLEGEHTAEGHAGALIPTARQVGGLLYRTARVRSLYEEARPGHPRVTLSDRPYPASGSCHSLEIYIAVNTCSGIPRGVYHYDPLRHRLESLPVAEGDVDELLEVGRVGGGLPAHPPLLMLVTARFRRLSWKYNGLSYSLVLKDLGHFLQTALLVSTAMGVPAQTLAGTDIELSSRVLRTDWRTESGIGTMIIGVPSGGDRGMTRTEPVNDAEWSDAAAAVLARIRPVH